MSRSPRRVSPAVFPLLVLLLIAPACQKLQEDEIRIRVRSVLSGIQAEGGTTGDKLNNAMLSWDDGQRKRESGGLDVAYNQFVHWSRKKDIDRRISDWEITGIEILSDPGPTTAIVSVKIEGKPLQMRVTKGERITWVD